jgi:hypothetical protein
MQHIQGINRMQIRMISLEQMVEAESLVESYLTTSSELCQFWISIS